MKLATRQRAVTLFGAMAHPTRLRIVELLTLGERTVGEITAELQLSQSGVSQHLAILTRAGVLVAEPRGSCRFYRVRGPRIHGILELIEQFCEVHSLYGPGEESHGEDSPDSKRA